MTGLLSLLLFALPARSLEIHPHPIVTDKRLTLTRDYCKQHYGLDSAELKDPQIIVIHATELSTLKASFEAFKADTLSPLRKDLSGHGEVNVGVHFLVDRNGDVYSLLPLSVVGRHVIGLNHVSIGIENVGFADKLTSAQLEADVSLVEDLLKSQPTLQYLIGHYEYTDKKLPHYALYKELDLRYRPTYKTDPGRKFMKELRKKLASDDVDLKD